VGVTGVRRNSSTPQLPGCLSFRVACLTWRYGYSDRGTRLPDLPPRRLTPQDLGLPAYGSPRRVKGLRREVAILAGVSVEYYNRMERGNLGGVSESVLDSLARALRLDDAERVHQRFHRYLSMCWTDDCTVHHLEG
jgi:hypothetical protein